jgi:hypothetical protein
MEVAVKTQNSDLFKKSLDRGAQVCLLNWKIKEDYDDFIRANSDLNCVICLNEMALGSSTHACKDQHI